MKLLRESEYIKVYSVEVERKEIDFDQVLKSVSEYLSKNEISGDKYEVTGFNEKRSDSVEIELKRLGDDLYNNGCIDEDFEADENWKTFCTGMAKSLEARRFSVPYWYYPK